MELGRARRAALARLLLLSDERTRHVLRISLDYWWWCGDHVFPAAAEHPGQAEVPPRPESAAERAQHSASTRPIRHRHAPAASGHLGDQDKEHDLQDQAQAWLHSYGLRCKVRTVQCTFPVWFLLKVICFSCFVCFFSWMFRGKIVLGYTEAELRVRGTGYQFIHAADMLHCAENHIRSKPPAAFILHG